jgi:hypothetical protein
MTRQIQRTCDICKRPTAKIVGKFTYVPIIRQSFSHANYTHHADVGVCCKDKLMTLFNWQPRLTATEYQERRRAG